MIRGNVGVGEMIKNWQTTFKLSRFLLVAGLLLVYGVLFGKLAGGEYGKMGLYALGVLVGVIALALIILLRQDEFSMAMVFAVHLYIDFYLALYFVALIITLVLLLVFYFTRSSTRPWISPPGFWLWILFLALGIFPSIQGAYFQGALNYYDIDFYYPNIILAAFLIYWSGIVVTRDGTSLRLLFKMLAAIGTFVAIHTIIQELTGITLFSTAAHDVFLASVSNYQLGGLDSNIYRAGSFFTDPNWNGTFLAILLFIALSLFAESSNVLAKLLYLAEVFLILSALLFTYSNGAWIGAMAGLVAFVIFAGRWRYRIMLPVFVAIATMALLAFFPSQISVQLQHANDPHEVSLRVAVWRTALRVILANPWTGVGFSHLLYGQISEAYRVPEQYIPEDHPHNSYLELAAMAGIPMLAVFLILILLALWLAWRNWTRADTGTRTLIGGGIAAIFALCVNSWSINAWTLPPIAGIGWLILSIISSPLLARNLTKKQRT